MKIINIKRRMKEYFFTYPSAKMRVREIERVLKIPLPSVIRYCKELEKESILARGSIGSVNFYVANRTNETYLLEKKLYNIKTMYDSGLIERIKTELSNPAIV